MLLGSEVLKTTLSQGKLMWGQWLSALPFFPQHWRGNHSSAVNWEEVHCTMSIKPLTACPWTLHQSFNYLAIHFSRWLYTMWLLHWHMLLHTFIVLYNNPWWESLNAPQTVKQLRETTYEPDRQIWHTSFAALQNCSLLYASGLCVPAKYPRGVKLLFII